MTENNSELKTPPAESGTESAVPAEKAAIKKKPISARLFDKESRLGRINRSVVRALGWFVGIFALGFFAAFLLLYSPKAQDYDQIQANYDNVSEKLKDAETQLAGLKTDNEKIQNEAVRYRVLSATYEIREQTMQVQMALQQHDTQGAAYALKKLQNSFKTYLPDLQKIDANLAKAIEGRLTVVEAELTSDSKMAQLDLETILKNLQDVKTKLQTN
ncbi:MAG: hypothetical protein LWX83_15350 [Anaerolineae bacterium]|nr:hypothetical protein [Anaerolineae bacterium]